jgi:hypothetical protein
MKVAYIYDTQQKKCKNILQSARLVVTETELVLYPAMNRT